MQLKKLFSEEKDFKTLAKEYIDILLEERINIKELGGVSIASDINSLEFITKRSSLIYNKTIISLNTGERILYKKNQSQSREDDYFIHISDLSNFGQYLYKSRELITNGLLEVYPKITKSSTFNIIDYHFENEPKWDFHRKEDIEINNIITEAIVKNKQLLEIKNDVYKHFDFISPVMRIEVPFLDNVDLNSFSKLAVENPKELEILKLHLQECFVDIKSSIEKSEAYLTEVTKIGIKLNKELILLKKDIRKNAIQNKFKAIGATLSGFVATLFIVNPNIPGSDLIKLVSGGLGTIGTNYLFINFFQERALYKNELLHNPLYFLWLIEKETH